MSEPKEHRLLRVRALIEVALPHLPDLPPAQRADVYRGIAEVTKRRDPDMCSHATSLAQAIEDAEALQLYFTGLLTEKEVVGQFEIHPSNKYI